MLIRGIFYPRYYVQIASQSPLSRGAASEPPYNPQEDRMGNGVLRLFFLAEENALFAGMRFQPLGSLLVLYEVSFPVTDAQPADVHHFMVFFGLDGCFGFAVALGLLSL